MRLLKLNSGAESSLTDELIEDIPRYAILSHTWRLDGDEVTFEDLHTRSGRSKAGYDKIRFSGEQGEKDGLQYFWVDTCCIKKSISAELQEAITSMFDWYRNAVKCYLYLSDVSTSGNGSNGRWRALAFQNSRWFKRGWTLQELLAPKTVEFFSRDGEFLGDKNTLEQQIHEATSIPVAALRGAPLTDFTVDERLQWAENRETKRKEDKAYCLLEILNVFMYLNYGEGDNAFRRLERQIGKSSRNEPIKQVWHVPFGPMPGFVGRADELKKLKQKLFDPGSHRTVSVLGLGGVGKSRLALELAYQLKSERSTYLVLWIQASDQLTLEKDVLEIGKKLKIPGIEDDKADIKTLVKQRLTNSPDNRWLLILDNADDEALWAERSYSSQPGSSLMHYLPITTNGSILITTRSRRIAHFLAGKEVVELHTLSPDEAAEVFTKRLETLDTAADRTTILILLDKLAYLPLAIVQAASFINETQRSVQTYLELLDKSEIGVIKLLSKDFGDPSKNIQKHHPLAAAFLSSVACLHEKGIPRSLLLDDGSKIDDIDIIDAIAVLTGYSFLTKQTGSSSIADVEELYDMHRLIQLAARNWLKMEG